MLRVVIDANVWISAMLNPGKPLELIQKFRLKLFQVYYPEWLITELRKLPSRKKFKSKLTNEQVARFILLIKHKAILAKLDNVLTISRDPKDNPYLACAKATACDFLISGDRDLLDLKHYGQTKIINTAEFLQILKQHL